MKSLRAVRMQRGLSQRRLATLAGLSYKSVQLIEGGGCNVEVATLQRLAKALGYPRQMLERRLEGFFSTSPDSAAVVAEWIIVKGEDSWRTRLFDFVDAFRVAEDPAHLIADAPCGSSRIQGLVAATVEVLCAERGIALPGWCAAVPALSEPWFVAGVENLKASALVESPVHFRRRNIFVLGNFLARA